MLFTVRNKGCATLKNVVQWGLTVLILSNKTGFEEHGMTVIRPRPYSKYNYFTVSDNPADLHKRTKSIEALLQGTPRVYLGDWRIRSNVSSKCSGQMSSLTDRTT